MTDLEPWYEFLNSSLRNMLPPDFPTIVCLCGSTRFGEAFRQAQADETLAGKIVLSVGLLGRDPTDSGKEKSGNVQLAAEQKAALDVLHKQKIDLADEVLILNVGGYIGDSTRSEVLYAELRGKAVQWLEPFKVPPDVAHIGNSLSDGPKVSRGSDDDPDVHGY